MKVYAHKNVVVEVQKTRIKLFFDDPIELINLSEYKKLANKRWLEKQIKKLQQAIDTKTTYTHIELATKQHPIRLGGGFAQLDDEYILMVKRDANAPRYPLSLDIPSGVYDDIWETPIEMMMGESIEILRMKNDVIYYPSVFDFQSDAMMNELYTIKNVLEKNEKIKVRSIEPINAKIVDINSDNYLEIFYRGKKLPNFTITFEIDSPSIEFIGLLKISDSGFSYADGELLNNRELINRDIYQIHVSNCQTYIWKLFKKERKINLFDELFTKKGNYVTRLTSKAFTVFIKMKLCFKNNNSSNYFKKRFQIWPYFI